MRSGEGTSGTIRWPRIVSPTTNQQPCNQRTGQRQGGSNNHHAPKAEDETIVDRLLNRYSSCSVDAVWNFDRSEVNAFLVQRLSNVRRQRHLIQLPIQTSIE